MSTTIPKDLFDKASSAVFTKTALSLEHCDEIVRIVLDAIELEASAKIISLESELAKLRELEAENREQYQIALRAKNERIKEIRLTAIDECAQVAQSRTEAMRQKVEAERKKETSLSVDYYQGRVNEGRVIESCIKRLKQPSATAESLFMDSLAEKAPASAGGESNAI